MNKNKVIKFAQLITLGLTLKSPQQSRHLSQRGSRRGGEKTINI